MSEELEHSEQHATEPEGENEMSRDARRRKSLLLFVPRPGGARLGRLAMVGGLALSHDHGTRPRCDGPGFASLAAKDLLELLDRNPGSDEALYLLGTCEKARGRTAAAAEAWAKISPLVRRSAFARSKAEHTSRSRAVGSHRPSISSRAHVNRLASPIRIRASCSAPSIARKGDRARHCN